MDVALPSFDLLIIQHMECGMSRGDHCSSTWVHILDNTGGIGLCQLITIPTLCLMVLRISIMFTRICTLLIKDLGLYIQIKKLIWQCPIFFGILYYWRVLVSVVHCLSH